MTADERAFVHTAGEDQARDPHFAQQIGSGYLLPAALEQDKVRHCPQALQIIPSPPEGTLKAGTEEQGHTHEQHQNTPPQSRQGRCPRLSCRVGAAWTSGGDVSLDIGIGPSLCDKNPLPTGEGMLLLYPCRLLCWDGCFVCHGTQIRRQHEHQEHTND